jgi:hypothetical protein
MRRVMIALKYAAAASAQPVRTCESLTSLSAEHNYRIGRHRAGRREPAGVLPRPPRSPLIPRRMIALGFS